MPDPTDPLTLLDQTSGGCGCGCGSATSPSSPTIATATQKESAMTVQTYSHTYSVTGMTCGHCVHAVTSEIKALEGVSDVNVELIPDGASQVTVTSTNPLEEASVAAALDEAGDYRLVS